MNRRSAMATSDCDTGTVTRAPPTSARHGLRAGLAVLPREAVSRGHALINAHATLDREEAQVPPVGHQPPQPLRTREHHADRERAEQDHVPGAVVGQELADEEEQRGADERALERAEP